LEHDKELGAVQLKPGETIDITVHARAKWGATPLWLSKGERYRFAASGAWHDANIATGPAGYESPSIGFRLLASFRRVKEANWFALIGTIQQSEDSALIIGQGADLEIPRDGPLYCFANDLPFMYFNNSGQVSVAVTRLS
jgi:hypothetical protein